jgi:hypothetical protein
MGRRSRRRTEGAPPAGQLQAPTEIYRDPEGHELELRGALTLKARAQYAEVLGGGDHQDDAWQRATEWLFERFMDDPGRRARPTEAAARALPDGER